MRKSLWTIAAIAALPAPAAAARDGADVCGALGRLVAAARERPAFASVMQRLGAREPVIPAFGAGQCEVRAGEGLFCEDSTMARAVFAAWPDLATCPGLTASEEVLMMDPPPPQRRDAWTRVYQADGVWIAYGVTCMTCGGPATRRFSVGFVRPVAANQ